MKTDENGRVGSRVVVLGTVFILSAVTFSVILNMLDILAHILGFVLGYVGGRYYG